MTTNVSTAGLRRSTFLMFLTFLIPDQLIVEMLSSYTRLFRILFVIVLLKLLFLVALYVRTYDGLARFQASSWTYKVDIFDEILVDRRDRELLCPSVR